jgi:hypothetical protein
LPKNKPEADFRKVLEDVARQKGELLKIFSDFTCMAACALAAQTRGSDGALAPRSCSVTKKRQSCGDTVTDGAWSPSKPVKGSLGAN